jgi:hypothetical protein
MGDVLSFSQKICTLYKCFVKKTGIFRPAGDEMLCQVRDRVSRITDTSYAVIEPKGTSASGRAEAISPAKQGIA